MDLFLCKRLSALWITLVAVAALASACSPIWPGAAPSPAPTDIAVPTVTPTPRPTVPPPTETPVPTSTFTPVPTPTPLFLAVGGRARVVLPEGRLNVRADPGTAADLLGRLAPGIEVSIVDGPARRNDLVWWKVDDGAGLVGWVAESDGTARWLEPIPVEPTPTPVALGPGVRARVQTEGDARLSLREAPGTESTLIARLKAGTEVTVLEGPVQEDGYAWWRVQTVDGQAGWAAEGDETMRWLVPLP
ncbi:MAG: SH3 domain-containing protein [Anaerolineae bacterium]